MSRRFVFNFASHVPVDFHNLDSAVYDFNSGGVCWCRNGVRAYPCAYLELHGTCERCVLCCNIVDREYTRERKCWYFASYAAEQGFEITRPGYEDPINNPNNPAFVRKHPIHRVGS